MNQDQSKPPNALSLWGMYDTLPNLSYRALTLAGYRVILRRPRVELCDLLLRRQLYSLEGLGLVWHQIHSSSTAISGGRIISRVIRLEGRLRMGNWPWIRGVGVCLLVSRINITERWRRPRARWRRVGTRIFPIVGFWVRRRQSWLWAWAPASPNDGLTREKGRIGGGNGMRQSAVGVVGVIRRGFPDPIVMDVGFEQMGFLH